MIGEQPRLSRLSQGHQFVSKQERRLLTINNREMALVREIIMGAGDTNWLFARTLIPQRTLKGSARRIAHLNDRPIGNILFGRNGAKRHSMDISLISELPQSLIKLGVSADISLWQRRSIFEFATGPLMVTEIFLPDSPIYVD